MFFLNPAILLVKKTDLFHDEKLNSLSTFCQAICEAFSSNKNASMKNIFTLRMRRREFYDDRHKNLLVGIAFKER